MPAGRYTYYCGNVRDGRIYGQLPLYNASWADVMDDRGNVRGTVTLADPAIAAMNVPSIAAETKCWLGVTYTDPNGVETWLQAGPIWNHSYDDTTKELTIQASGLWSLFDHRKIIAPAIANGATNTASAGGVTYSGWSLGTIAKKILGTLSTRTGGLPPVVFQTDQAETADDDHSRTYNGWDLANAGTELGNLTQALNGPEITFRPQYQTDARFIQWAMQTGTETVPLLTQNGADWVFDATRAKGPVAAINVETDGTQMGDAAWAKGNGSEAASLIGVSIGTTLTDLGYPFLDVDVSGHDSVEKQSTINGYAQIGRTFAAKRIVTVTVKVDRDASPGLNEYQKGDYVQLIVGDHHPYLPAGTIRSRIVQLSGDDTNLVALQLAPVLI